MLSKISVKSGTYVEIVPLGLLCTLQYNSGGILEKIILNYNESNIEKSNVLDPELTLQLKKNLIVPQRINFTQGTTWIKGVFYTKKLFKDEGCLPECIQNSILSDLALHMNDYTFYAGYMKNDSYNFNGASIICTRLRTFGFNVLPGCIVYDILDTLPIQQIMKNINCKFTFPLISGIMAYEDISKWKYIPAKLNQCYVKDTSNYLDEYGYLHTSVKSTMGTLIKSYTDIVQYDVQPKSVIILDDNNIVFSHKLNKLLKSKLSRNTYCTICGKPMTVPVKGFTCCHDEHCPSKLYPSIKHFLSTLSFPAMSFKTFMNYVKSKEISCLIDVLLLDEYKDLKVECTLSTLLFSIVPVEYCRSVEFFQEFVNHLGSIKSLDYYIQNPDTILNDLNLNPLYSKNFIQWLKDPSNVLDLETLLHCPQIKIRSICKKFEGLPIFRNKTICITGKFKHGTLEDIIEILQSYSGKVTTTFNNTVNCVLIGHFEEEDTKIVELATSYNIPIYGEDDFFESYEIDIDIANNSNN